MARPSRCRRVCEEPAHIRFAPSEGTDSPGVVLTVDEYEVLRLVDYQGNTHAQCAEQMEISRTTVTEIYDRARFKVADCLVNGKPLQITGGHYRVCGGGAEGCRMPACRWSRQPQGEPAAKKGAFDMRIAIPYEAGSIFQHFGHTKQFKLYDIQDNALVREQIVSTGGSGHGALADFLRASEVDAMICGGIGAGAQTALAEAGISLYGGVSGSADSAVKDFLRGEFHYDPNVRCDHHGQEHGSRQCGRHGCHGKE